MQAQTAVVLGATGFIGKQLVELLINNPAFTSVRLLVRKPITYTSDKVKVVVVDFNDSHNFKDCIGTGDTLFCCIGTTMKQVNGDKKAYRKIDFDIPVNAALFAKEAGFTQYVLVSSAGADKTSGTFYLQLKGAVEEAINNIGFESLHIFRPSMLMGQRNEFRLGEWLGKGLMKIFSPLLMGKFKKYRGVTGYEVASAMVHVAVMHNSGTHYYEYEAIKNNS